MSLQQTTWTPARRDRAIASILAIPVQTPCNECAAFRAGWCQHWKSSVPPENQAAGCSEWSEQIPF